MEKRLAIEHHLIRPNEVIELLEMMGGKNKDNADGCSYLYYTLCTPKINNPNNDKVICGFTNLKMQNDHFAIFTLEKFWKKYPYKVGDKVVYEDDNDIVVISEIIWDDTVGDIFYNVKRIDEDDCFLCPPELLKPYKETNMNKKLAIRGHSTRGKEVIEILEMMGGKNNCDCTGDNLGLCYLIDDEFDICAHYFGYDDYEDGELNIFTLEEFLEKYPFKVGDKVMDGCGNTLTIKSMSWSPNYETMAYDFVDTEDILCAEDLLKWNAIDLVEKHYGEQCEEMMKDITLKHLYELGMENIKKEIVTRMDIEDASFILNYMILPNKVNDELEYKFPDGYEFDKVENGKIILKPIKSKYPNDYKTCCDALYANSNHNECYEACLRGYPMDTFARLLICRDAYWKIAGEEIGLDKPWKPVYETLEDNTYFIIQTFNGEIDKSATSHRNAILAFPTIEMRDAFYENFKELIEKCKELL